MRKRANRVLVAVVTASFGICVAGHPSKAEDMSEAEMMKALSAQPNEGVKGTGAVKMSSQGDDALIDKLRQKSAVSLTLVERKQLDQVLDDKPKIDLEMDFDYRSDVLRGKSLETAKKLGHVLSNASMKTETFMIAGHTDAKGSAEINRALSQRRAEAVKRYLVEQHGIAADHLISVGYGKEHLKNPGNPLGRENRRVQAVNMMAPRAAER